MSDITKKKQSRKGHCAYTTKTLAKVKGLMESSSPGVAVELVQLKLTLTKIETIKKLDESIVALLEKSEDIETKCRQNLLPKFMVG